MFDKIKRGDPDLNGAVVDPDKMINVVVTDK